MAPGHERIVVGVDGSPPSVEALRWAARHAAAVPGAVIEVVTVCEQTMTYGAVPPAAAPGLVPATAAGRPDELDDALAAEARRAAEQAVVVAGLHQAGLSVRTTQLTGHPASVLVDASRGADLLVIGPSGHGALVGLLLGSVATHLITHASCPVVVVRGGDDAERGERAASTRK
jgi:nucleotide-binding universal stress UspA family protein